MRLFQQPARQLAAVRAGYSSAASARGGRRDETNWLWRIFRDQGFLDRPQWSGVADEDSVDGGIQKWNYKVHHPVSRSGEVTMKFKLFEQVALAKDIQEENLRRGDVATVVDSHPPANGGELGYSIEVFNAIGETIAIACVPESYLERLTANEILHVRPLTESGAFRT
jgi:hypothetical protein